VATNVAVLASNARVGAELAAAGGN
jgi:hypothetical protein